MSQTQPTHKAGEQQPPSPALFRLIDRVVGLGGVISSLLILCILVLVSYAVFQRYVLGTPLQWADELAGYLIIAFVMLGAAQALRQGDHIAIDLLSNRLGQTARRWLDLWSNLAVLAFAAVVGISTWQSIVFSYSFGSYSAGYIEIATWIPQVPMLVGAVLLALAAMVRAARLFNRQLPS